LHFERDGLPASDSLAGTCGKPFPFSIALCLLIVVSLVQPIYLILFIKIGSNHRSPRIVVTEEVDVSQEPPQNADLAIPEKHEKRVKHHLMEIAQLRIAAERLFLNVQSAET
jgi:hypothetical protein